MSYYPLWHTTVAFSDIPVLIPSLKNTCNREVMIRETSYPWTTQGDDSYTNQFGRKTPLAGYPFTVAGPAKYLTDLTQNTIKAGGTGIMYRESE